MTITTHLQNNAKIAEVIAEEVLIKSSDEALDLLVNLYYQDFDKIILHEKNISSDFFDLKTGLAGEMLQKFSNYRMHLAIIGDFSKFTNQSINAFIFESNKVGQINFISSVSEALAQLSKS